jgi:predicted dehydrogenase
VVDQSPTREPGTAPRASGTRLKAGILGCGHVSRKHVATLRKLRGVELAGVCDRDAALARRMAHVAGCSRSYSDLPQLLAEAKPDVVHILTPPQSHRELAIQAMRAGCHVLVEKPMALTVQDAAQMTEVSHREGVSLCVCHNFLFEPCVLRARDLVASGAVGKVVSVDVFWRLLRERLRNSGWIHDLPGGVFHEVAPHPFYLLLEFVDAPRVASVSAATVGGELEVSPDELRLQFEGATGLASVAISVHSEPHLAFMRIHGTRMTLWLDFTTNTLVKLKKAGVGRQSKLRMNLGHGAQLWMQTTMNAVKVLTGRMEFGHAALIRRFYDSLRTGSAPPVTPDQGRAVVAMLDETWRALGKRMKERAQ